MKTVDIAWDSIPKPTPKPVPGRAVALKLHFGVPRSVNVLATAHALDVTVTYGVAGFCYFGEVI